jgi:hypothetical protein
MFHMLVMVVAHPPHVLVVIATIKVGAMAVAVRATVSMILSIIARSDTYGDIDFGFLKQTFA